MHSILLVCFNTFLGHVFAAIKKYSVISQQAHNITDLIKTSLVMGKMHSYTMTKGGIPVASRKRGFCIIMYVCKDGLQSFCGELHLGGRTV